MKFIGLICPLWGLEERRLTAANKHNLFFCCKEQEHV